MKLTDKQINKIKEISRERYPNEAVFGITKKGIAIELDNIADDPLNDFEIDSSVFYGNGYIALVHSHTIKTGDALDTMHMHIDPRTPSELDQKTYLAMGEIPFGILALDDSNTTDILWFIDKDEQILGREYVTFTDDCYALVRRYYWQNYQINLPDFIRIPEWWKDDPRMFVDNITNGGFKVIQNYEMKEGDMLLFHIGANALPSHCGIYIGNNEIIHHSPNRLSEISSYTKWSKRITHILRHLET